MRTRAELEPSGNVRGGGSCWVKRATELRVSRRTLVRYRKETRDVETCVRDFIWGLAGGHAR